MGRRLQLHALAAREAATTPHVSRPLQIYAQLGRLRPRPVPKLRPGAQAEK